MSKYYTGMILVCINNLYYENQLTINKQYVLINKNPYFIDVNNDLGNYSRFYVSNFITLDEYNKLHRIDKLKNIFSNDI